MNITHNGFMSVYNREMRKSEALNANQELLILGAVALFWEHNKNIAYLNYAMNYARARSGMRVNAVKAFLTHFTGARYSEKGDKKNQFVKGGKMEAMPIEFGTLNSWLAWADEKAAEPEYDLAKAQLKVISFLQKEKKKAKENGANAMADMLARTILEYAQAQKEEAPAIQAVK